MRYGLLLFALACTTTATQPVDVHTYIVVLKDNVAPGAVYANGRLRAVYHTALNGFAIDLTDTSAQQLASNPAVKYVERDQVLHATGTESVPGFGQYGLDRIDQRTVTFDGLYHWNADGTGVRVYVFDTGIRLTHVDFGGRAVGAYTAYNDGNGFSDCNGHGTHVAGIIGGTTYGVAKNATLESVRILDCNGFGLSSTTIAAIDWLNANAVKPAVVNMSLDGPFTQALNDAITNSITTYGITYIVAAGNDAGVACNFSPASVPSALTVGATDRYDGGWPNSNTGSCVDLLAPGVNITSDFFIDDNSIGTLTGTSMSTPFVTGGAALYLQGNPTATPAAVASAIKTNATADVLTSIGTGTPNLMLYTLAFGGDQPPVAQFTSKCKIKRCTFDASASTDDHGIVSYAWNFGDGMTGSGAVITHSYASTSYYLVTLTVTDTAGQTSVVKKTVHA